eukprot:677961-Ditylum_brightwellii.AAC.1
MDHDEGPVACLNQGSESCNTLHEPGLVAFWVSEEEGLFHLDDGGGEIRVRGNWGIRIVGIAKCFADVLLELPFCLFLLKEAAVDKRGAAFLLSEKGVLTTQAATRKRQKNDQSGWLLMSNLAGVLRNADAQTRWQR